MTTRKRQTSGVELLETDAEALSVGDGEVRGADSAMEKAQNRLKSRIGFGSCTSRVAIDQSIWGNGIIPSDIDAWIWCALRALNIVSS